MCVGISQWLASKNGVIQPEDVFKLVDGITSPVDNIRHYYLDNIKALQTTASTIFYRRN